MGNNMMEDIIGDIINEDMITWEYTQPSVFNGDMIEDVIGDILGVVFFLGTIIEMDIFDFVGWDIYHIYLVGGFNPSEKY